MIMEKTFVCESCRQEFITDEQDEEIYRKEYDAQKPTVPFEDAAVLCEQCYAEITLLLNNRGAIH